jgi:hypothetical protein
MGSRPAANPRYLKSGQLASFFFLAEASAIAAATKSRGSWYSAPIRLLLRALAGDLNPCGQAGAILRRTVPCNFGSQLKVKSGYSCADL